MALTRDGGASWTWMCEQQIEGNGGDVDPSIVVTGDGSLVVLSLTNGGVLVSRDDGCSFERAMGPLQGHRGVDLTLDPSEPGRVLALTSTIIEVVEAGYPRFRNLLAQSTDHGRSWEVLAELPDDLSAETVEIAASDADRIYANQEGSSSQMEQPTARMVDISDPNSIEILDSVVQFPGHSMNWWRAPDGREFIIGANEGLGAADSCVEYPRPTSLGNALVRPTRRRRSQRGGLLQ